MGENMRKLLVWSVFVVSLCSACVGLGDDYPGGPRTLARQNREIQAAMTERQRRIDEENRQKYASTVERRKRIAEFEQGRLEEIKKMEYELQNRYLNEYLKNEKFQYIVTSENYDELINNLIAKAKSNPQIDQATYSEISRNNICKAYHIYIDLTSAINNIDKLMNNGIEQDKEFEKSKPTLIDVDEEFPQKKECLNRIMSDYEVSVRSGKVLSTFEGRMKFYNEALVTCGLKDSQKGQTLKASKIYGEMSNERSRVYDLRSEVYLDAYGRESASFLELTGFSFDGKGGNSQTTLSDSLNNPQWKPESGLLFSLQNMQAMQTIDDGILITSAYPWGRNKIAFLNTKIDFVDGAALDGYYANFVGSHKYQSVTGPRNVYAFKLFPYNRNQLVNGIQFYFYPNVLPLSE